ncbi:MAG TPA: metal-dependent hydrolase [Dehalococcoidales bacterium]
MLLFGHVGITLGAGLVIDRIIKYRQQRSPLLSPAVPEEGSDIRIREKPAASQGMAFSDALFCVIGSILPDIIDKPIGNLFFKQEFGSNGRIFSHTMLFFLVFLAAGLFYYRAKKRRWLLYLAFGVFLHLVLDSMWQTPQTLFWPLLGWRFPASLDIGLTGWLEEMFQGLIHDPATYISEIIGFVMFAGIIVITIWRKLIVLPARSRKKL